MNYNFDFVFTAGKAVVSRPGQKSALLLQLAEASNAKPGSGGTSHAPNLRLPSLPEQPGPCCEGVHMAGGWILGDLGPVFRWKYLRWSTKSDTLDTVRRTGWRGFEKASPGRGMHAGWTDCLRKHGCCTGLMHLDQR